MDFAEKCGILLNAAVTPERSTDCRVYYKEEDIEHEGAVIKWKSQSKWEYGDCT